MDILHNFPVSNAILITAIQADRLPISQSLNDAEEKSIVCSLLFRANSKNLRAPITISRKTLGIESRQGKTALYQNLKSLKQKGIIEDEIGKKWIRFTEQALALMTMASTQSQDQPTKKVGFYRFGQSNFPIQAQFWANKDVNEKQLRTIMSFCKTHRITLQTVLNNYQTVLERYSGTSLFAITLDIIRQPQKYQIKPIRSHVALTEQEKSILVVVQQYQTQLLHHGEKIICENKQWFWYQRQGKKLINAEQIQELNTRMMQLVKSWYQQYQTPLKIAQGTYIWSGLIGQESHAPIITNVSGKLVNLPWHVLYAHLPQASQTWLEEPSSALSHPWQTKIGSAFAVKGTRYLLETVQDGMAYLKRLSGQLTGRITIKSVHCLQDHLVQWE